MDKSSSLKDTYEAGLFLCWGRLKFQLPWRKRCSGQRCVGCNLRDFFKTKQRKPDGGSRYDPSSYAQNFDEGCWDDDDEDSSHRGFSSRFAVPVSKTLADQ